MADEMASRIAFTKSLLPQLDSALNSFTRSSAKFRVLRTVQPLSSTDSTPPAPKTLYILDSSFNPPSTAHLAIATSALKSASSEDAQSHRLLLLFSTHNADKAPSAASFPQRLALMTLLAEDLHRSSPTTNIPIDIGVVKEPYYTDKSQAISTTTPNPYPSDPIHVHLLGYDTLTRFLAPKYYPNHHPPLSALAPFFEAGHRLIVTQRPSSSSQNVAIGSDPASADTAEAQAKYLEDLKKGKMEAEGFKAGWADQISMVEGSSDAIGVSSTKVRKAAKRGDWEEVGKLCTPGVAAWVREEALYESDDRGAKMA